MEGPNHKPSFIPQIGVPEKEKFQEKMSTHAIYHKVSSPVMFGLLMIFFFMPFINVKCGGQLVKKYSGIDIIQGEQNKEDKKNGRLLKETTVSPSYEYEKAREKNKWKQKLKEDYEKHIHDAPYFEETPVKEDEDPFKIPENLSETSKNPVVMRVLTIIAILCAIVGFICSFKQKKTMYVIQFILSGIGSFCMLILQYYIKVTMPQLSNDEYQPAIVTIELAMGYWLALILFIGITIINFLKVKWFNKWMQSKMESRTP